MNATFNGIYLYGSGFGISFDWSSQTWAGSRNGGWDDGIGVVVGGLMGPVFVLKSTRIVNAVETNIDNKTNRRIIIWNSNNTNNFNSIKVAECDWNKVNPLMATESIPWNKIHTDWLRFVCDLFECLNQDTW